MSSASSTFASCKQSRCRFKDEALAKIFVSDHRSAERARSCLLDGDDFAEDGGGSVCRSTVVANVYTNSGTLLRCIPLAIVRTILNNECACSGDIHCGCFGHRD